MADERKPSPEKQLLNLIENPKAADISKAKAKRHNLGIFSFSALKARFSFFGERFKGLSALFKKEPLSLKTLNRVLKVCVLVLALYLGINLVMAYQDSKKPDALLEAGTLEALRPLAGRTSTTDVIGVEKKLPYYLDEVAKRNIFKLEPSKAMIRTSAAPVNLTKLAENLKLVGIAWSKDPDALVEDKKTGKTYFVKQGDYVEAVKIKRILRDHIILGYRDEEMELR